MAVRSVMGILLQSAIRRNCGLPARRANQSRPGSACPVPEDPGCVIGNEPAPERSLHDPAEARRFLRDLAALHGIASSAVLIV
jgi:hypothetical protein